MAAQIDKPTPTSKLVTGLLDIVSEFESDTKEEHRLAGIEAAKARGVKFGRKPKMNTTNILQALALKEVGYTNKVIAKEFGVGRSTLLRYLAGYRMS